jgi:hypothetical protein
MKLFTLRTIVLALVTVSLIGCSTAKYVEIKRIDFSRIKDTKITAALLTNGDTLYFNWEGGQYIQNRTKDSVEQRIVGLNERDSAVSLPMSSVVRVYGEYSENDATGTVALTVVLTVLTELAIVVALLSSIRF